MAAMLATERRWLMRRPSCELVARNGVSWQTVRSYDRPWRGTKKRNFVTAVTEPWRNRPYS